MLSELDGKNIQVWCGVFIYAGKLVGFDDYALKLADAYVVYDTGPLRADSFLDSQKLPDPYTLIPRGAIESISHAPQLD